MRIKTEIGTSFQELWRGEHGKLRETDVRGMDSKQGFMIKKRFFPKWKLLMVPGIPLEKNLD